MYSEEFVYVYLFSVKVPNKASKLKSNRILVVVQGMKSSTDSVLQM